MNKLPYIDAIEKFSNIVDFDNVKSPYEMINVVVDLGKMIEKCINSFWDGITIINPEKLTIDGENLMILYTYIIVRARIPSLFAYAKMMDKFSTAHVRSQSHYGYCTTTL